MWCCACFCCYLPQDMLTCDYSDTFTDAFEVSNKVVELLMLRQGDEVCCTDDRARTYLELPGEAVGGGGESQLEVEVA